MRISTLCAALIATLLAPPAPQTAAADTAAARALFCPQDEQFIGTRLPLDERGLCTSCGRRPVELESAFRTWFWCAADEQWKEWACARQVIERCCEPRESTAVIFPCDARVPQATYCPDCGRPVGQEELNAESRCARCHKPPVTTDVTTRTWTWCRRHTRWHEKPCAKGVGVTRKARLLAAPVGPPAPEA